MGPRVEQWKQEQLGVSLPPMAVGADCPGRRHRTAHTLHMGFVLVATGPRPQVLQRMAREFHAVVRDMGSASPSTRCTSGVPNRVAVDGHALEAEDDLFVLGVSVVAGGLREYERRVAKAWFAFYAQGKVGVVACAARGDPHPPGCGWQNGAFYEW